MRRVLLAVVLLALVAWAAVGAFRTGPAPSITFTPALAAVGKRTPVAVEIVGGKRGLGRITIEAVQSDRVTPLAEQRFATAPSWKLWVRGTERWRGTVDVGKETIKDLKAGTVTVRATAERAGSWLRHPAPAVRELSLPVRLSPPTLQVLSIQTYVRQGGSEAVVYRVGETATRHGVVAGDWFFPGAPLPGGGPQDRFALFSVPYDMAEASSVKLVAADEVGNESRASFIDKFYPDRLHTDTLPVTDAFLEKVVPSIMSQTPELEDKGSRLENYLQINRDLRRSNNAVLKDLAAASKPEFLWSTPFRPFPNAKITARFADRRTYVYQGRSVDQQDHLGLDMAATRAVPVPSTGDGVVVLAKFFGIYGNAVIVDHGYGLMSLYGHLSSIDVKEGQTVKQGDVLGRTGDTGLAGGDHLHFAFLLHGLPVTPIEWWDGHWIQDRIARKLGPGFRFNP